jgi:hypothetical protein
MLSSNLSLAGPRSWLYLSKEDVEFMLSVLLLWGWSESSLFRQELLQGVEPRRLVAFEKTGAGPTNMARKVDVGH